MKVELILALLASTAMSADLSTSIKERIQNAIQMGVQFKQEENVMVGGIQNCFNKCDKLFNNFAYTIITNNDAPAVDVVTNEYRACAIGCNICLDQQNKNLPADHCLWNCKDYDFLSTTLVDSTGKYWPIQKGVIEPDKACQMGCVQQLCQGICTGGTPDHEKTKQNANKWWKTGQNPPNPALGCTLLTNTKYDGGFYSQNGKYNFWNSAAGSGAMDNAACCSNGMSLCQYVGDKNTDNYNNLVTVAKRECAPFKVKSVKAICKYVSKKGKGQCGYQINTETRTPPPI